MQLLRQLTPSQTLAVIDLALDIKPDRARRVLLGLPPARHDHDEQHDPEVGLDRLVEHMSSHHWWADADLPAPAAAPPEAGEPAAAAVAPADAAA